MAMIICHRASVFTDIFTNNKNYYQLTDNISTLHSPTHLLLPLPLAARLLALAPPDDTAPAVPPPKLKALLLVL